MIENMIIEIKKIYYSILIKILIGFLGFIFLFHFKQSKSALNSYF